MSIHSYLKQKPNAPFHAKLDAMVISNLLSTMVGCADTRNPPKLSELRIRELLDRVRLTVYPLSDLRLLEQAAAVYTLSLYFALSTRFETALLEYCSLAQSLMTETLIVMQAVGTSKVMRCRDPLVCLNKDPMIEPQYCLEIFTDNLEVARKIGRETITKIRHQIKLDTKMPDKDKEALEHEARLMNRHNECIQPHALYFMCAFGLSHVAAMLKEHGNLSLVPGIAETVILAMLTVRDDSDSDSTRSNSGTLAAAPDKTTTKTTTEKKSKNGRPDSRASAPLKIDFATCMEKSQVLAVFMAHRLFDVRYLQEIYVSRSKLQKRMDHPDITKSQFHAVGFKEMFKAESTGSSGHKGDGAQHSASQSLSRSMLMSMSVDKKGSKNNMKTIPDKNRGSAFPLVPVGETLLHDAAPQAVPQHFLDDLVECAHRFTENPVEELAQDDFAFFKTAQRSDSGKSDDSDSSSEDGKDDGGSGGKSRRYIKKQSVDKGSAAETRLNVPKSFSATCSCLGLQSAAEFEEAVVHWWQLKNKSYRPAFLALRSVGAQYRAGGDVFRTFFVPDFDPVQSISLLARKRQQVDSDLLHHQPAVAALTLTDAVKIVAVRYFTDSASTFFPRQLNPASELYWIVSYALSYLHEQAVLGLGFAPTVKELVASLRKLVKTAAAATTDAQPDALHLPSINGASSSSSSYTATQSPLKDKSKTAPSQSATAPIKTVPTNAKIAATNAKTTNAEKLKGLVPGTLDLGARLALASKAAGFESRLHAVERAAHQAAMGTKEDKQKAAAAALFRAKYSEHFNGDEDDNDEEDDNDHTVGSHSLNHGSVRGSAHSSSQHKKKSHLEDGGGSVVSAFSRDSRSHTSQQYQQHAGDNQSSAPADDSVVWHCPPKPVKHVSLPFVAEDEAYNEEDMLKQRISQSKKLEYAAKIEKQKQEKREAERKAEEALADAQFLIVDKTRATKKALLMELRERQRDELDSKLEGKRIIQANQRRRELEALRNSSNEEMLRREAEMEERANIRNIRTWTKNQKKHEKEMYKQSLSLQAHAIENLLDQSEADWIARALKEEERMRYLEERQMVVEAKRAEKRAAAASEFQKHVDAAAIARDLATARVRMGVFKYVRGKLGFYDAVRPAPVEWVQYEDEQGTPYYFDPLTGKTQYRLPQDAGVRHYTVDLRIQYDSEHGEGAYDAMVADIAFKDAFNANGGYYDENGAWVQATGNYDENYEWVQWEGFTNAYGIYVKFAKAEGDLNFMV